MNSVYHPTTAEVREDYTGHDFGSATSGAEFDRWLSAERRKWQAEALRDAASELPDLLNSLKLGTSTYKWLRERAAELENGEGQ